MKQDWAAVLALADQTGRSLEQVHIFALAHILRRPIVVYGVRISLPDDSDFQRSQRIPEDVIDEGQIVVEIQDQDQLVEDMDMNSW